MTRGVIGRMATTPAIRTLIRQASRLDRSERSGAMGRRERIPRRIHPAAPRTSSKQRPGRMRLGAHENSYVLRANRFFQLQTFPTSVVKFKPISTIEPGTVNSGRFWSGLRNQLRPGTMLHPLHIPKGQPFQRLNRLPDSS